MAITKSDFAYHNVYEVCVSIKISLLLHDIFCYIAYEIILFNLLQLTPGGVFMNMC